MNNLYEKENLLPYVVEQQAPVEKKVNIFKRKLEKNGLATTALTLSLSSLLFGVLLIPSVAGITLGVGALILAFKRGSKKVIPVVSIVISVVTLVLSILVWVLIIFAANQDEPKPMVPPGYTYDSYSGIAYAYNPVSNIPCDSEGVCNFEVKLYQATADKCVNGGRFTPDMQDLMSKISIPSTGYDFTPMAVGDEQTLQVSLNGLSNGRLNEANKHLISCKA